MSLLSPTLKALEANQIKAYSIQTKELFPLLESLMPAGSTVGFGGSMTLFETKTLDWLKTKDYNLLDRYAPGLSPSEIKEIYRRSFFADFYLSSANAVTASGSIYNVDGNGNRVAALSYGPDKVIMIVGKNKLVATEEDARLRVKNKVAVLNAKRLNQAQETNKFTPENISSQHLMMRYQMVANRLHLIILDEDFGF